MAAASKFRRVCIVGVGLIGGSLGMAIKRKKLARLVVGVVRKKKTVDQAFRMGALDVATLDLREGVRGADLVILCAPVMGIVEHLKKIGPWLAPGAVVIDVGSSKSLIERVAKKSLRKNRFVGCHPMAGSEKCGTEFADAKLFEGSICFVTSKDARVAAFWKALGATPIRVSAKEHDAWTAKSSHLPHLSAFSLFNLLDSSSPAIRGRMAGRLNPSLLSSARLSQSSPELWSQILVSNREELVGAVAAFGKVLKKFETALRRSDAAALKKLIARANRSSARLS